MRVIYAWWMMLGLALAYLPTCKIFAVPPWAPQVSVLSALWNGGGSNLSLSPCFPLADPCILGDWPFCVEWTSNGPGIVPEGSF